MTDKHDEIKTILYDLSTSDLTASARLIAVIHALGIEAPAEVQKLAGLKPAGERKARNQLKEHRHSSSTTTVAPPQERSYSSGDRYHSSDPPPQERYHSSGGASRTCARIESPSGIVIPLEVASNARAREPAVSEIDGLNGHTSMYVRWLAGWLNEFSPDDQTAHDLLAANVDIYGPDQVKAGMSELQTMIAAGDKPRNLAKAFPAYVKNASTEARPFADRASVKTCLDILDEYDAAERAVQ